MEAPREDGSRFRADWEQLQVTNNRNPIPMKTSSRLNLLSLIATILPAAMLMLSAQTSHAGSATWLPSPPTYDWNTATNWTAGGPPNGPADTATFNSSIQLVISLSNIAETNEVNGIVFNADASPFTIRVQPRTTFRITGAGITNSSGITQDFVTEVEDNGNAIGYISFSGNATAGNLTRFTNEGQKVNNPSAFGGQTFFSDTSTASNGIFINNGGAVTFNTVGGGTQFFGDSTAGNGTFTNNGGAVVGAFGGYTRFGGNSTAANGTFTNNGGGVAGSYSHGGSTSFGANSTAANGTFINNGTAFLGSPGFDGVAGTFFYEGATAGNSTLIANGGTGGGVGGSIRFNSYARGGTARVQVFGNGNLDISNDYAGLTTGSIEGTGNVFLGAFRLTVGSNNLSTTFSGVIQDGGVGPGGGSLTKIGSGTLTLSGANTYTGGTLINAGTLQGSHDGALGVGDVSFTASGATLRLQSGATNNYISDTATLSILSGSTVDLNYGGAPDTVRSLIVGGVVQPAGVYGSAASGAPHPLPQFTGSGTILVTTTDANATWNLNPESGVWNTAANWTPAIVPDGPKRTATFAVSNTTNVSANAEVNGIVFNSDASAFAITAPPTLVLTISGGGITNSSGIIQNFVTAVDGAGNRGRIVFTNSATAGSLTVFTNAGNAVTSGFGGLGGGTEFHLNSTAGDATFINNGGLSTYSRGGQIDFFDTSTAGNGTFTTNGSAGGTLGRLHVLPRHLDCGQWHLYHQRHSLLLDRWRGYSLP